MSRGRFETPEGRHLEVAYELAGEVAKNPPLSVRPITGGTDSSNPSPSSRESRKLATASAHSNANGTVCALRAPLSPSCLEILSLYGCKEGDQKPEDAAGKDIDDRVSFA